jgi:hypothetical protein
MGSSFGQRFCGLRKCSKPPRTRPKATFCCEISNPRPRPRTALVLAGNISAQWILVFAMLLLVSRCVRAGDVSAAFDQANKLYEQGKYAEAATAYGKLAESGQMSAALYFNLGNAFLEQCDCLPRFSELQPKHVADDDHDQFLSW